MAGPDEAAPCPPAWGVAPGRPGEALVHAARALKGTPFRAPGLRHGVDCLDLVLAAARRAGLDLGARPPGPARNVPAHEVARMMLARGWTPVEAGEAAPGDMLISWPGPRQPHFALLSFNQALVEADGAAGRVRERACRAGELDPPAQVWRLPRADHRPNGPLPPCKEL